MSNSTFLFDEEAVIGDDHPVEVVFYDKADDGTLTPENLADRDWFYSAKSNSSDNDTDAAIALNPLDITIDSDNNATLNPTNVTNRLTFWLPRASTELMSEKNYIQDIQSVEISSSRVFTKGIGTLTMLADATKRTS